VVTRVQVAASGCLVASGLLMCGLGGALASAEPEHRHADDSMVETDRGDRDGEDSTKESQPNETEANETNTRENTPKATPPDVTTTKERPTTVTETKTTTKTTTTRPSTPTETPPPGGDEGGGGGGGGGGFEPPRGRPEPPPEMQLPPPREVEPGGPPGPDPAVINAGPPAAAGLPVEPINMPVIVSPPFGLGGGSGPVGPGPPGSPRGAIAAPPAGRERLPATIGGNTATSHRIGYTDYLRTAGLPQLAALAVPGVGGILVLTAAGGLVGYRQAKAGHAVRSGTTRFMN
jgi:hypothetical protein